MKRFRFFTFFLLSALYVCDACAGSPNAEHLITAWGGAKWNTCGAHKLPVDACIGTKENDCNTKPLVNGEGFSNLYSYVKARANNSDEAAIRMMVAWEINANGARFCPVQIESANKNRKSETWTEYRLLPGECVWLCKAGYTGEGCNIAVADASSIKMCDIKPFKRDDYINVGNVQGSNLENSVRMFAANNYVECSGNVENEHDIILAVVGWLESKHGAKVRQMTVRAAREGWKKMVSWAEVYPAAGANEILVCKSGYQPNATGDDCVEINVNACKAASVCSGWNYYNEKQHSFKENDGCYQYRCSDSNKAFKDAKGHECVECSGRRRGAHPDTGLCTECKIGEAFDRNSGKCEPATAYSKTDLQYGFKKTKNSAETGCWEMLQTDDYVGCITGKCLYGKTTWTGEGSCNVE